MKLVEILARELDEWPEDKAYGEILCITQDNDMSAASWEFKKPLFENGEWVHPQDIAVDVWDLHSLATDHTTAIVTREMWEAERERIKLDMYSGSITTKPKWRGSEDGLPPIGSQVMFKKNQCEVIGYHNGMVVCAMDDDYENGCYDGFLARDLRPIPTDREKWIEAAMNYWDHEMPRVSLEHIYDAGLAKLPD